MGMGSNFNNSYRISPYDYRNRMFLYAEPTPAPAPVSNINNLVQQALAAQANPVSMDQLFPYMNYGTTNNMGGLGGLLGMTGQYGAGRFLGGNAMGNTGMTSNAMNTM